MKYTDAEWKAQRDEAHFGTLSSIVAGEPIGGHYVRYPLMIEVGGTAGSEEQEGNTRLASAALDMYKALKGLIKLEELDFGDHSLLPEDHPYAMAEAAIAKAERQ